MQVTSATTATMNSSDTVASNNSILDQNDFLKLLVAQMQNQNPLEPQSNSEMAAQMAQFTSLQQSTAMSSSLSMLQANSLIGSTVTLQIDSQTSATGVVQGVVLQSGDPQIVVDGTLYTLSQVTGVAPTPATTATSPETN